MWFMACASATTGAVLGDLADLRRLRLDDSAVTPPKSVWELPYHEPAAGIRRVDGVAAAKAWGAIRVDAPIEAVWQVLNDEERLVDDLPISTSAVLSGELHGERRVFEYLPLPIVSDRWWVVDIEHNDRLYTASDGQMWEMAWRNTDPALIERTHYAPIAAGGVPAAWTMGSWLAIDLGEDGTWLEYTTWSDPGGSLPVGPATSFASGAVKKTLLAVAHLAEAARDESRAGYVRPDGSPL